MTVSTRRGELHLLLCGVIGALVVVGCALLGLLSPAGASQRLPTRNTSSSPNCTRVPPGPYSEPGVAVVGRGSSYPVLGSIDANGCDSSTYELAPSFGPSTSFFAGSGFLPGQHAFEYGTQETTELIDGHQLIRVVQPTRDWLRAYKGYDVCSKTTTDDKRPAVVCIAPTPERRPDDLVLYIPLGALLVVLLLFVVHFMRPAGPIRRRRHYQRKHEELVKGMTALDRATLENLDLKQLRKRLARLEKFLSPEISSSQHYWFHGLMRSGRHGLALESLTRWLAESSLPVPDHIREEVLWIASSLDIEREVRPVLDEKVHAHDADADPESPVSGGFDVPLDEFKQMVADAVDALPEAFGRAMSNVAVVVEEEADGRRLFGLYEGHPLSKYRIRQWSVHPDKITIYRRTICEHCHTLEEVRGQVYRTVIHEIAHHFGIDDPRLRELGW
jgi:predicted Zn-dependent protease with MMP-like domain